MRWQLQPSPTLPPWHLPPAPAALRVLASVSLPLALQTAGDAGAGFSLFGMDIAGLQQWTLIYLGLSSLAFVLVWVIGFLRR